MQCPCKSLKSYEVCCQRFHLGEKALTSEDLMRSRYTAFALGLSRYLFETELSSLHEGTTLERFDQEIKAQHWVDLQVLRSLPLEVEFQAALLDENQLLIHHETSAFVEEAGTIKYAKALVQNSFVKKIERNDPCPCGSGKKFKKCNHDKKN